MLDRFPQKIAFALKGIRETFRSESNFRVQTAATLAVLIVLVLLQPSPLWWALVALSAGSVLGLELLNTAIEELLDRLHPEKHAAIGRAKDRAAGSVLIMSLVSLIVFAALFWEHVKF